MYLPASLLVLAAISIAASNSPTEKDSSSSQTTKRELLEGNFGQRTAFENNNHEAAVRKITPGIQYADNLKQELHEPTLAEQIFGSRIFPITKISDLLTGQGPPFDIALTNHLYAPISVYNAKSQKTPLPVLVEIPTAYQSANSLPSLNPHKVTPQPQTAYYVENPIKKVLSRKPNFHVPGILGPEFYSHIPKHTEELLRSADQSYFPELYKYKQQVFNYSPYLPANYNQQQIQDDENQEDSLYYKEESERKADAAYRPEEQDNPSSDAQVYHSHPHGGISYSNYKHNQDASNVQPEPKAQNWEVSELNQKLIEAKLRKLEQFHVPRPPKSKSINRPQDIKLVVQDFQEQYVPSPGQTELQLNHLSGPQFASAQTTQRPQFYLHPVKTSIIQHRPNPDLKLSEIQQPVLKRLPNAEATLQTSVYSTAINHSTPSPKQFLEFEETRNTGLQSTQESLNGPHHYTPLPALGTYPQSVLPLKKAPITEQSPIGITTQPHLSDQVLQSTTIQPDTIISETVRDSKQAQQYLSQQSNSIQTSQPTLQTLSTINPSEYYVSSTPHPEILKRTQQTHVQSIPHHQVQIQQQEFREIHSELAPQTKNKPKEFLNKMIHELKSVETISEENQSTTPKPTPLPKADYEIEIDSHVDHSQLPKDLQPVTTAQETNNLLEHGLQRQQFDAHEEQKQTRIEESRTQPEPIPSFGETPSYQNINYRDPNLLFLSPPPVPFRPIIQPGIFSNRQEFVIQPQFQTHVPSFPPVQYFGNYAQSLFGVI